MASRRNKYEILLPSAVRAATNSLLVQQLDYRQALIIVNVSAVPTVDTVTPTIHAADPFDDSEAGLLITGGAIVAVSRESYLIGASHETVGNFPGMDAVNRLLPSKFKVTMTHSAGTDFTYSVSVQWLV
jgi:hypothetical protein